MPRFTLRMNVLPSISLETPKMCVETLRTGLIFPRWSIWEVTCLCLLSKWMFSHLSSWQLHKCVLKSSEQDSFFQDDRFEGSHAYVYSQNECYAIYLLGNPIKMSVETLRTGLIFARWLIWRGHMPRFTLRMNVFQSISLETPKICVETLRTGLIFPRQSIWGVTCLCLLSKWMFSHLFSWQLHKCVLKSSEQG